jgi:pimeloyl-ACP methyl ester carboxylesterase
MLRRRKLLTALLLLGCTIVGLDCSANRLILGSNHDTIDPGAARREMIKVNGRSVECWVARSPGAEAAEPEAFVLFFVGKSARVDSWMTPVANAWSGKPVEVWGMNYPGSGGSDGPVQLALVAPNALGVYDAVKARAGAHPVFIQASSFGTTAALAVAARRRVAGLVLQNPPPLRQLILGRYGWWNLWLIAGPVAAQIPGDLDSLANAARCSAPAVFIVSEADNNVPAGYQQRVVNSYAGPKRIITRPGAGHDTPLSSEAADTLKKGKEWMWEVYPQTHP